MVGFLEAKLKVELLELLPHSNHQIHFLPLKKKNVSQNYAFVVVVVLYLKRHTHTHTTLF